MEIQCGTILVVVSSLAIGEAARQIRSMRIQRFRPHRNLALNVILDAI